MNVMVGHGERLILGTILTNSDFISKLLQRSY